MSDISNIIQKVRNFLYSYVGGDKTISDYIEGEKIKFETDFKGLELTGNDLLIKSSSGALTLQNVANKLIDISGSDEVTAAYAYLTNREGVVDGSNFPVFGFIAGAANLTNLLIAGAVGSSLLGNGGNNTLQGGAGKDFFIYNGGNDTVDNYENGDVINFDANFTGIGIAENNFFINSNSGAVMIRDAVDKIIDVATGDGNIVAHVYMSDKAMTIDGRALSGVEVIIGGGNGSDVIQAGDGGSSVWGGNGNFNDFIYGGAGQDEIFYTTGNGNDEISNVSSEDVINLLGVNLNQISGAMLHDGGSYLKFNDGGTLNIAGRAGKFILEGKTYRADYENKIWVEDKGDVDDGGSADSSVTLTRTDGTNNFTYANGDGDVVIADYVEGQDVIKLQSGLILNTSYDGDDVIFMVGGDYVTVKNGKGKNITITDAFGNTSTANYTPSETVTEMTEDEMLESLHDVSKKGLKSFVNAFSNVNFQELADAATDENEKILIESLHTIYDTADKLIDNEIVLETDSASSADVTNKSTLNKDEVNQIVSDYISAQGHIIDLYSDLNVISPSYSLAISMGLLGFAYINAYFATNGNDIGNVDYGDQVIGAIGQSIGSITNYNYNKEIKRVEGAKHYNKSVANHYAGVNSKTGTIIDATTALIVGAYNTVIDFNELKEDGWKSEEVAHVVLTLVVDSASEFLSGVTYGVSDFFLTDEVKAGVKDGIADAFISDSEHDLTDKHSTFFRANPSVYDINASKRKSGISITGNAYNNSIFGGIGNDTIDGGYAGDTINGNAGDDSLIGGSDNDTIYGVEGNDTLIGDYYGDYNPFITNKEYNANPGIDSHIYYTKDNFIGSDTFVYSSGDGHDVIMDYEEGIDIIKLSDCQIISSTLDGDDVILNIGEGSVTLKNAKGKKITIEDKDGNIDSKVYPSTEENDNIPSDAYEYNGHSYYLFNISMTWNDAKERCESMGGHLVTVTDSDEQAFIESINTGNRNLWIGLYRPLASLNDWQWVTDESTTYDNWGDGEPNNSSNVISNENCAAIWPKYWNDLSGSNVYEQSGFICEWDYTRSSSADLIADTNFMDAEDIDAILNFGVSDGVENVTAFTNAYELNQADSLESILAYSNG